MRYWSFTYPGDQDNAIVETWSEDDIIQKYYPHWEEKMIHKFGKATFEEKYCKLDCIDDWVCVNWAWEV